jgi:Rab-GTPase-TBC domain
MPKEYYSNMLALRADIQLTYILLSIRDPDLVLHFEDINMDMSLITVENFLTLYTNTCHPDLAEVIMDHFLMKGPVTLLKTMLLLLSYMRNDILETESLSRNYVKKVNF